MASSSEQAEKLHDILQAALIEEEGGILTGWCLSFEMVDMQSRSYSGYFVGPQTPPWKALGLLSWAEKLLEFRHMRED